MTHWIVQIFFLKFSPKRQEDIDPSSLRANENKKKSKMVFKEFTNSEQDIKKVRGVKIHLLENSPARPLYWHSTSKK